MKIPAAITATTILSLLSLSASAMTTRYSYTGNTFDDVASGFPAGATAISGFFDVADALGSNFEGGLGDGLNPTRFEFNDGLSVVTNDTTIDDATSGLYVRTNGAGEISAWIVAFSLPAFNEGDLGLLITNNESGFFPITTDFSTYCTADTASGSCGNSQNPDTPGVGGRNVDSPGTWTGSSVSLIEPDMTLMLALGLLSSFWLGWRRKS